MYFNNLNEKISKVLSPLLNFLYQNLGLTPNKLSAISFFISTVSVIFVLFQKLEVALIFLLLALIFDGLDGAVARYFNLESELGEKLELIFDRTNETMLFLALAYIKLVTFKIAILAIIAILLMTLLRDKSKFDPGFKRTILFFGYFFHNFPLALNVIFLINLFGFVVSLLILDQMKMEPHGQACGTRNTPLWGNAPSGRTSRTRGLIHPLR